MLVLATKTQCEVELYNLLNLLLLLGLCLIIYLVDVTRSM